MELRLEEALEGPVSWREDVVLTDEELRTLGLLALDAGDASGELRALDGSYLLSARASWHAQLECTRCLEPSDHQSDADFQVLLRRASGEASAAASAEPEEFELEADDLNVVEVADGVVDPRAFVVVVMFGASASFATPIGYQTNTMVYNAGGYRFTDFLRLGLPMNIIAGVVTVLLAPVIWPLTP